MANLQGYGTNSVGNMLNHYTRHAGDPEQTKYRYANQDIDQTRTHLNYAIFARDDPAAFVQSKIDALNAAQSSIQSLLDAQERREQLERQLRSLETASGR